ncbi:ABC transporter permease [Naasia lichenicola]|uniref:ABC transporter permease n=1 Tax=Naasia lichenicola TaxID=2565933 RepID=A0A4S4FEC0_9MICO|nr:ABC transporter permease [Naasia lichenicola]THG28463.1 ABC transporter permease [Naasia lichenicola]
MAFYILRRLLQAIPVLLGATFLIYFMVFAMPGNPALALFGERTPNPAVLAQVEARYHLDQPFIVQYLYYLGNVFRLDFGTSFSGQPIGETLLRTFPVTARLAALAILFEMIIGLAVGLWSGLRKGGVFDSVTLVISLVLISVPIFVLCFLGQFFLGYKLGWFRSTVSAGAPIQDLILPALILAFSLVAFNIRLTRSSVIETAGNDFVRTAYSKGLRRSRVIPVHILRNSLIPVTTNLGADFGILLVGATVTEGIFNVPGVGNTLYKAIVIGERPTVVSFVTVMVLLYLVVNILIDLLYAVLDPRIRYVK